MFTRTAAAGLVLLAAAYFAPAQTGPQLLTVFPPGARAGQTVEVRCTGIGFDGDEKLLFSGKGFTAERVGSSVTDPKAPKGSPPGSVTFKVTPPPTPGTFDVRLVSKNGLSNPRCFVVGPYAEVNEREPNNDVDQAQKIEPNTTVNGVISAATDVDYVTFRAKAGQGFVIWCRTTSIDSRLAADLILATADGRRLAENRGYRGGEAVIDFVAPVDGDYLVRVSQFAYTGGGPDHFYRLTVSTGPWVEAVFPPLAPPSGAARPPAAATVRVDGRNLPASLKPEPSPFLRRDGRPFDRATVSLVPDPDAVAVPPPAGAAELLAVRAADAAPPALLLAAEHPVILDPDTNDSPETAQPLTPPCDVAGRIGKKNDRQWYRFTARKGDVWTIELFADRLGSQIDAYFVLTDEAGQVIAEADDAGESLSPNQFYTRSDDPARYRFVAPADGTYRLMVSGRDASVVYGPREQYVLRIAPEKPDFRLAVMPVTPHLPDAVTLRRGGAAMLTVFVFRLDGFNEPITLTASGLPPGLTCPPQTIAAGQTRGVLVLTAAPDAPDWEGFVTVTGVAGRLRHEAKPFTVTWPAAGAQANQPPPNTPMLTRSDRGGGLALAVRGEAPFALTPAPTELKAKAGEKFDVNLKVTRSAAFKDPIAVFSAVPNFGLPGKGNQPPPPIATIPPDQTEAKLSIDVAPNTPPGTYTLVLRGQSAVPPPKGGNAPARPVLTFPAVPITVTVEGTPPKKK